jgi:hypothetical protein
MAFEPIIIINGLSQLSAAAASLLLARKLRSEKSCLLLKPFYLLSLALFCIAFLNILWFSGFIDISALDNLLIGPFFHLAMLAIWFYLGILISGHDHMYYLIPVFIMSINALLLLSNLAVFCDLITGLVLIGVFFYVGLIDHHLIKKVSYLGMLYGFLLLAVSITSHFMGLQYLHSFWFIPNIVLTYLIIRMRKAGHICASTPLPEKHHIPVVVEVFKFGFFVIGLSIFLMLGILGVHELGHSLAAKIFSCSHATDFGIGYAVTHVVCESSAGSTIIILGGLILTLFISLLMHFLGNDFARRLSYLLISFSMLTAIDDFAALDMPKSIVITMVFVSMLLIGYGLSLVVKNYELEYQKYEASVCATPHCEKKVI